MSRRGHPEEEDIGWPGCYCCSAAAAGDRVGILIDSVFSLVPKTRQRRLHCGSCSDSHRVYLRTQKIERLVMRWLCCLPVDSEASEHGYPVSTILMRSAIDWWTEEGRKVWTEVMPSDAGVNVMRVFLGRKRNGIAHSKFNRVLGVLQIE